MSENFDILLIPLSIRAKRACEERNRATAIQRVLMRTPSAAHIRDLLEQRKRKLKRSIVTCSTIQGILKSKCVSAGV